MANALYLIDQNGDPIGVIGNPLEVSGGALTDAQLRAAPVPVSATFTPSGTQNVNLTQVGGGAVALGQATNAASLPVALSSSQTGTAGTPSAQVLSVQGVSGGTPLPTSTNVTPGSTVSEAFANCSSAQILLAAVAAPKVRKIYNRAGNGRLFIRYGSAPTAETDCNFAIEPGSTWEMPVLAPGVLEYAGAVYGLIPSGSSTAHGLQVT